MFGDPRSPKSLSSTTNGRRFEHAVHMTCMTTATFNPLCDLVRVGYGLVSNVRALALARQDRKVTVFER